MKDKLIEIIRSVPITDKTYSEYIEAVAERLIFVGTVMLPCKVGETVFCIRYDKTRKPFVKPLAVASVTAFGKGGFIVFTTKEDIWGVTAFATAKEAERKLKGTNDEQR